MAGLAVTGAPPRPLETEPLVILPSQLDGQRVASPEVEFAIAILTSAARDAGLIQR